MITNPRRKKRIEEFLDKNHSVMSDYYDILEAPTSDEKLKEVMKRSIEKDPDFYDAYLVLSELEEDPDTSRALMKEAFERAVQRIADVNGDWPVSMIWGWLENRHLMRALERWALELWEEGNTDEALDIFRRLFHANPGDNQGVRHSILALCLGLGTDWCAPFEIKDGPMAGEAIDLRATSDWFEENAKKFPEEFDWWPQALKDLGYKD